ncbi:MAG: sigma 54-interacting transcriptional regulator [Rhizobacter sp.]|nr:sigma 54-interacting transcriptional regulator [Chlorobiales bacterium]
MITTQQNDKHISTASADSLPQFPSRYRGVRPIAATAASAVYHAYDDERQKEVAIKVLKTSDRLSQESLLSEADILAGLRHPNIVGLCGSGLTPNGKAYIAVDFLTSPPLDRWALHLRQTHPAPYPVILGAFAKLFSTLSYIASQQVIHGDLKPANVFVNGSGGDIDLKVLDFGGARIAKTRDAYRTNDEAAENENDASIALGTLSYAAPELFLPGAVPDSRSDLYSAGVMLFEALTGRHPFGGVSDASLLLRRKMTEQISLASIESLESLELVPPGITGIVQKLLDLEPAKRFTHPAEAFAALEKLIPEQFVSRTDDLKYLFLGSDVFDRTDEFQKLVRAHRALASQSSVWLLVAEPQNGLRRLLRQIYRYAERQQGTAMLLAPAQDASVWQTLAQCCIRSHVLKAETVQRLNTLFIEPQSESFATWTAEAMSAMRQHTLCNALLEICASGTATLIIPPEAAADEEFCLFLQLLVKTVVITDTTGLMLVIGLAAQPLPEALAALEPLPIAERLHLQSLTREKFHVAVGKFFTGLDSGHIDQIYGATGGSTSNSARLISQLIDQELLRRTDDGWTLPVGFAISQVEWMQSQTEQHERRLTAYSHDIRKILALGAVMEIFSAAGLAAVLQVWENSLFEKSLVAPMLSQALTDEILVQRGALYSFPNAHLQAALQKQCTNAAAAHRAIAEYFETGGEPTGGSSGGEWTERLAYHFAQSHDDDKAFIYLLQAARTCREQMKLEKAAALYESAAALESSPEARFEIARELSELYQLLLKNDQRQTAIDRLLYYATLLGNAEKLSVARREKLSLLYDTGLKEMHIYAGEMLKIAWRVGDRALEIDAYLALARSSLLMNNTATEALEHLELAIVLACESDDVLSEAKAYSLLGRVYQDYLMRKEEAVKVYRAAMRCYERLAETKPAHWREAVIAKLSIAKVYINFSDFAEAETLLAETAPLALQLGDQKTLLSLYHSTGFVNLQKGYYSEALEFLQKARLANLAYKSSRNESLFLGNISLVYVMTGNYPKAVVMLSEALVISRGNNDKRQTALILSNLAHCSEQQGDFVQAKLYLDDAMLTAQSIENPELILEVAANAAMFFLGEHNPLGDLVEAGRYQSLCEQVITASQFEDRDIDYTLPKAWIALREGRPEDAERHAGEMISKAAKIGHVQNGIEQFYFSCYRLYAQLRRQKESMACLEQAYKILMQKARQITSESMRESFLTKVRVNQEIEAQYNKLFRTDARRNLSVIYEISRRINVARKVEEVISGIFELGASLIGASRSIIFLREPDGSLVLQAAQQTEADLLQNAAQVSQSVLSRVSKGGAAYISKDVKLDELLRDKQSIAKFNIQSIACLPIKSRETVLGVIYMDSTHAANVFTDDDLDFLEAFANLCGIAIENAQAFERQDEETGKLRQQKAALESQVLSGFRFDGLLSESPVAKQIELQVIQLAKTPTPVLIEGESGTGKELTARAIHQTSARREKPFMTIDTTQVAESLLESELFGHVKGAFTGADRDKKGLLELADSGTVFIDEINSASLAFQSRLLRFIQEGTLRRVGDTKERKVDVRIIATSNQPLQRLVAEGKFRQDLYYRLDGVKLVLPPLRDRKEDIEPLANYFLGRICEKYQLPPKTFSPQVLARFKKFSWDGNIRQLTLQVERLVVLSGDKKMLDEELLSPEILGVSPAAPLSASDGGLGASIETRVQQDGLKKIIEETERAIIETYYKANGFHLTKTAEALQLSIATLSDKIKKHGIKKS